MQRIAYIIPGNGESYTRQKGYNKIAGYFKEKGIEPRHIEINWKKEGPINFNDYNKEFLAQVEKIKGKKEVYVLGFSFGAVIAFLTAQKIKPTALILCSLSPYFREDMEVIKPKWKSWWNKNFVNSNYSFDEFVSKINSKTYVMVGDQEDTSVIKRAKDTKSKITDSKLVVIKNAKHKISQKEYLEAIKKVILRLYKT